MARTKASCYNQRPPPVTRVISILLALLCALGAFAEPAGRDFTVVALPDTQFYSEKFPDTFVAQVEWIIANREKLNIVYVAHLGDIVQNGDNQRQEWVNATNALYRLLAQNIPLGVVPGNHDHPGGTKLYNEFVGLGVFTNRPWYGGHFRADNQNHYDLFEAGGSKFVVVYADYNGPKLDYAPLDEWANSVLQSNANRRAIAVTHCILNVDGTYDPNRQPSYYHRLQDNPNLFLMLCGHNHGEAYRAETNKAGVVHIALSDYQADPNGGNGWLRLYEFSPSNNVIRVRTYSPTLDEFRTGPRSQFEIPYSMTKPE